MDTLRKIIADEIKKALQEDINSIQEPSEQIIKGVQKVLKLKTGINVQLTVEKSKANVIYYTADLSKEIRTPVLQSIFTTLSLNVSCRALTNVIGGYSFDVSVDWTHPQGGSNGKNIGTIFYQNNKFSARIL